MRILLSFALAFAVAWLATPVAIRVAYATAFMDRPERYKKHLTVTPYLGGSAVVLGIVVSALVLAGAGAGNYAAVLAGAIVLWIVGTIDDRRFVSPLVRVAIELGAAAGLQAAGLGWEVTGSVSADFLLTACWIVAVVNSFNLFDNLDGATASMAAIVTAGAAVVALISDEPAAAALSAAVCGACLAFLRYNLSSPAARIFLGDGGSMPVGFLVAAVVMIILDGARGSTADVLIAVMLVGVPALDTALVIVSRTRRGVSILTGGRDHVTHRTLARVGTPRRVALVLVVWQAAIAGTAITARETGTTAILFAALAYGVVAVAAITAFEMPAQTVRGARSTQVSEESA